MRRVTFCLILMMLVSACNSGRDRGPALANVPRVQPGAVVTVQTGDSLYDISRREGVALRDLITVNGLQPPYNIRPGDKLLLPRVRGYVVRRGDTVSEIAERFNVSTGRLIAQNGLAAPYVIFPGQELRLPAPVTRGAAQTRAQTQSQTQAQSQAQTQASAAPRTQSVQSQPLQNQPLQNQSVQTPQASFRVIIPQQSPVPPTPPAQTFVAEAEPAPAPQTTVQEPERPVVFSEPPRRSSDRFLWPVQGQVISGYGAKGDGLRNDGINIAAPAGLGVKASENGVVAYVGDNLQAFGNLILLRHQDGYMTAYAHLQAALVREGDVVRRGQVIGRVGNTGSVSRPQLHFEIRRAAKPVDPVKRLEPVTG